LVEMWTPNRPVAVMKTLPKLVHRPISSL